MLLTRVTGFVRKKLFPALSSQPKAIGHRASDVNKPINFQQHLNSFETVEVVCARTHRDARCCSKKSQHTFVGWLVGWERPRASETQSAAYLCKCIYQWFTACGEIDWNQYPHANNIGHCGRKHTLHIYRRAQRVEALGARTIAAMMCGDGIWWWYGGAELALSLSSACMCI